MSEHTPGPRRPGHLYVLLAPGTTEPEEQFIELEDHLGNGSGGCRHFFEDHDTARYRLLEFPDPAAHDALKADVEELERINAKLDSLGLDMVCQRDDARKGRDALLEALEKIDAINGSTGGAESLVREFKHIARAALQSARGEGVQP